MLLFSYEISYLPDAIHYDDSEIKKIMQNLENGTLMKGTSIRSVFTKIIFVLLRPDLIAS
jgi:hypothetical protein